jgi:hypothetical protein
MMTDEQLASMLIGPRFKPVPCVVTGGDYRYEGKIVSVFFKDDVDGFTGPVRCIVQDTTRRLFVHNATQVEVTV